MSTTIPYGGETDSGPETIGQINAANRKKVLNSIGIGAAAAGLGTILNGYTDISNMFNNSINNTYTGKDATGFDVFSPMSNETIISSDTYKEYGMDMSAVIYDDAVQTNPENYDLISAKSASPSPDPIDPTTAYSRAWRSFWDYGLALGSPGVNAVNASFQSNMLDDVRHTMVNPDPLYRFDQSKSNDRIGRVYGQRLKKNWRVVQFQIGKDVSNLSFLNQMLGGNDLEGNYKQLRNESGIIGGIAQGINQMFSFFGDVWNAAIGNKSKLIDFRETMNVYFDYINELMFEMAVSLGLSSYQDGQFSSDPNAQGKDLGGSDPETSGKQPPMPNAGSNGFKVPWGGFSYAGGHPGIGGRLDIRQFLGSNKSLGYGDSSESSNSKGSDWKSGGFLNNIGNMISQVATKTGDVVGQVTSDKILYIPFILSHSVTVSETWSNSTEEHPLMSQVNQMSQQAYTQNSEGGAQIISAISSGPSGVVSGLQDFMKGVAANKAFSIGAVGELASVQSGLGRISLPEIWSGSSFERSYNLTFKFYSPYGDKLSVFENVLIPTFCLLAMVAPKKVGNNSFMAPFMVRAYAVGLFACNFGIVSSLTLTKGEDKNEKTVDGLPKLITASMTIKDLIPDFMISMNKGAFNHASNSQLLDWMWIMSSQSLGAKDWMFKNTTFFLSRVERSFKNLTSSDTYVNMLTSNPLVGWSLKTLGRFFPNSNGFEAATELRNGSFAMGSVQSQHLNKSFQ